MFNIQKFARLLAIVVACLAAMPAHAADTSQFTEAERQLFVYEHLASLKAPTNLHYRYYRNGSLEPALEGKASVALVEKDNQKVATVDFLSGKDKLKLPPFEGVKGNPVILYFLEREIREMKRLTGGSVNYYRKRIRMALATEPKVIPITVEHQGKQLKATQISIAPYADDPARPRYEKFADKQFVMVLSDQVPGGVVSMRSELRQGGTTADKPLLWSETMVYDHQQ